MYMPYFHSTPISGDTLAYYTENELYDAYIREGRSHTDAEDLSQNLCRHISSMYHQERRMWQRYLREKGLWETKKKSLEV